jgi:hypothetical protein
VTAVPRSIADPFVAVAPAGRTRTRICYAMRDEPASAIPSRPRPGKRGNPPKIFSLAGEAPARNYRKAPQIGLMIAKTLFLM